MKKHLKSLTLLAIGLLTLGTAQAQDLSFDAPAPEAKPVNLFRHSRVVNGHSTTTLGAHEMDVLIRHRFGYLSGGFYELFGMDQSFVRLALEYGITNNLMVGIGRSSTGKIYDGFVKYRILQQEKGGNNPTPLSLAYVGTMDFSTQAIHNSPLPNAEALGNHLNYTHQLLATRQFGKYIMLQLMPTIIHNNRVQKASHANTRFALGTALALRVRHNLDVTAEYYHLFTDNQQPDFQQAVAIGIDLETGGHVFSIHFTNAVYMNESSFITQTTGKPTDFDVRLGFNLSRRIYLKDPTR